jgi:fibronectin type 3 domain-containing protein
VNSPKPVVGYNIYRSVDGGKTFRKRNTSPIRKTEYDDLRVRHGTTYSYFVKSVDKNGMESGPSNTIQLTVP